VIDAGVEASTDERRRGLSWSGGRAALSADASATLAGAQVSARVTSTRGSARHAGADAVADLQLGATRTTGPFDLEAHVAGHVFAGADRAMDYAEIGATGRYTLGPAQVGIGADFAPAQAAIGGSNLYLHGDAGIGIPATPLTLSAHLGRSSGSARDDPRAARLRPGGTYVDWRLGVEHVSGPVTIGLDYGGTDIDRRAAASAFGDVRNSGERLAARARFGF
jgi:hypothetical protein